MRAFIITISGLVASLCTFSPVGAEDLTAKIASLRTGMTAEEVGKHLSSQKPERIVRQVIYRRHLEQWYYNDGSVRLEFDCRPNEEPRLHAIIQLNKP
jgi:hypothetical protein